MARKTAAERLEAMRAELAAAEAKAAEKNAARLVAIGEEIAKIDERIAKLNAKRDELVDEANGYEGDLPSTDAVFTELTLEEV